MTETGSLPALTMQQHRASKAPYSSVASRWLVEEVRWGKVTPKRTGRHVTAGFSKKKRLAPSLILKVPNSRHGKDKAILERSFW